MNSRNIAIGVVGFAVVGLGAIALVNSTQNNPEKKADTAATTPTSTTTPPNTTVTIVSTAVLKDGSYSGSGAYSTPAGQNETVQVELTLKNNVIETVDVKLNSSNSTTKGYQNLFLNNYKSKVVGKNIKDIKLDEVAGSSLTSIGFNKALEAIKGKAAQ